MKHFLLTYTLAPDYLERRPAYRVEHLTLAKEAVARGELVLGGPLNPAEEAVLLFAGEDGSAAEAFARADPYVRSGIVSEWRVREWITVVGEGAMSPV
ncbi:MAG: YciI family protein [Porphyrobacter sp.]|nr:YciI family protein [Porphyrobacter sp.]